MSEEASTPAFTNEDLPVTEGPSFADLVPQDYADRGWVKDVPDIGTFFKMFDDQKVALSRRAFPGEDASEEEVAAYRKAVNVPEQYEGVEDEELARVFQEAHINGAQAAKLAPLFSKSGETAVEPTELTEEQIEAADAEFKAKGQEIYGDRYEEVLANAQQMLKGTPKEVVEQLMDPSRVPNEALLLMAGALDRAYTEAYGEDSLPGGGQQAASAVDLRAEAKRLMAKQASMGPMDVGYDELTEQINKIYAELASQT